MDSPPPSTSSLKRTSSELDSNESLSEPGNSAPARWPKFLLVSSADETKPIQVINAVVISKAIAGQIGSEDFEVTRLRSGDLLVKVSSDVHSRSLFHLSAIHFHGVPYPVKVQPHQSLNSSKGVARCREFKLFSEDEIVDALTSQGVTQAKCMSFMKDGLRRPSGTVILSFNTPELPERIKLGFMVIKIDPYVPNPMRCFQCQKFGHTASNCKHEKVCCVCSEKGHDDRSCSNQPKCANCEGNHTSFSKDCPLFQQEKRVQELKIKQKLSYYEAKKIVLGNSLPLFSSVVTMSKLSVSTGTQTDPTITTCQCGKPVVCSAATSTAEATVQHIQTNKHQDPKQSKLPTLNPSGNKISRPSAPASDKPAPSRVQSKPLQGERMDTSSPPSNPSGDSRGRQLKKPDKKKTKQS